MDALIIGGFFSTDHEDSLHHSDDFRLTIDGLPMSIPNLVQYFKNNRKFDDINQRLINTFRKPYQQVYYSSLHLYNLLTRNGFDVSLLNCHDTNDPSRLDLYKENPGCVVISTTFMNMEAVRNVVRDVRMYLPDVWIVVGGCYTRHSYLVWQKRDEPYYNETAVLNKYFFTTDMPVDGVDVYIYDEHGEKTLLEMIGLLRIGQRPYDLPNTVVAMSKDSGMQWRFNKAIPEQFVMDHHPIRWKNIPGDYLSTVIPFSATYGCPFSCNFCNFTGAKSSKKSLDVIFQELRELASHRIVQRVWFTDDNFLLNPKVLEEFCERYIQEDLPFSWMNFIRANSITPKTVELLKKSKCCLLLLGLESGSQKILNNMGKKDDVENYRSCMNLLIHNDIDTEINFIFGYPGETDSTVTETIDFINSLPTSPTQINYMYLFKFNLLPLSPIFEKSERKKWELTGNFDAWSHKTMASGQVDEVLRRVAGETNTTVFNYLDPMGKLSKKEMVRLMRLRDSLARSICRGEEDSRISWDKLEDVIKHHFGFVFNSK